MLKQIIEIKLWQQIKKCKIYPRRFAVTSKVVIVDFNQSLTAHDGLNAVTNYL